MVYLLDIFTAKVSTRVGNWCKGDSKTTWGLSTPPADNLVAALTWLGKLVLSLRKVAVKTQKTSKLGWLL